MLAASWLSADSLDAWENFMRNLTLRLVFLAAVLTPGACADNPTQSDQRVPAHDARRALDPPSVQCTDGTTICLDPVIVIGYPGGDDGGWSGGGGDDGGGSDPGGHDCMASDGEPTLQGCTGGGGETDPDEDESTICPQPFLGNVQPALITVAGRSHEFQFHSSATYPFVRLTGGRSPATYRIGLPTTSRDAWWIAESGTIRVWCRGAWVSRTLWVGTLTLVDSDLHMVMGPGHPDF